MAMVYVNWLFTTAGKLGDYFELNLSDKTIREAIEEIINKQKVVIFSKSYCPLEILDELNQKYAIVEVNKNPKMDEIQDLLNEMTGARTVPRVFINGKCIGGGAETASLLESGELKNLLL